MEITTIAAAALLTGAVTITGDDYNIERFLKPDTKVVRIVSDDGGLIDRYIRNYRILKMRRIQVQIVGRCVSACMMYMKLPGTCAEPGSQFWAHTPWLTNYDRYEREAIEELMRQYYVPSVVTYINRRGGIWKIGTENYMKIKASNHLPAC